MHHHFFPPAILDSFVEMLRGLGQFHFVPVAQGWSPSKAIEAMDRNGVAIAMLSMSNTNYFRAHGAEAARRMARACNDYAAEMRRAHSDRFGHFAALPMPDVKASLREIEYALDVLKADGIGLMTNYGEKWPGDSSFAPVLEELNRRKAIVFFHPVAADCCAGLIPDVPASWTEFPHDTTRAVTSLLFSRTFARLKDICCILPHAGGTIPFLAGRIKDASAALKRLSEVAPRGVDYELKRLYYETAGSLNRPAIAALLKYVPLSQVMFGTDFPYSPIERMGDRLDKVGFGGPARLRAIGRGNAERLIPRLKA